MKIKLMTFMKTRFSKHVRSLSILCWTALAAAPRASAQTPPTLNLQLYAGLSITAVVGTNPSGFTGDTNRPVETVSWFNATNYCGKLTQRERAAGRIATNSVYRLPTEAEWEYACRAWTSARFSYGDDEGYTNVTNYA